MFVSLFSCSTFYCWARNRIKLPSPPGKISSQYLFFKKSIKSCKTVLKSLSRMGTFRPYFVDLIFRLFLGVSTMKSSSSKKKNVNYKYAKQAKQNQNLQVSNSKLEIRVSTSDSVKVFHNLFYFDYFKNIFNILSILNMFSFFQNKFRPSQSTQGETIFFITVDTALWNHG